MKQPKSKLRDNEKVIYSTSAQTSGFIIMGEGGYLYLTNKRLFLEKIGTGDVRYSFELNVIDDCRSGISINLFLLPFLPLIPIGGLKCAKLYDKNGIAIKTLSAGIAGFGSKELITQIKNVIDNFEPEVGAKVEESTISDESPKDKLKNNDDSIESKIEKLKSMLDKELITEDEFNAKKQKLIDEI